MTERTGVIQYSDIDGTVLSRRAYTWSVDETAATVTINNDEGELYTLAIGDIYVSAMDGLGTWSNSTRTTENGVESLQDPEDAMPEADYSYAQELYADGEREFTKLHDPWGQPVQRPENTGL